ncbi:glycosyltransferase family 4 protein [Fulvimonas soli]|uniref:Glycosyltransferase involved in cell wall biosynthesis n=2 Tax=Fulvimonas soli TaxID=155197 RepID=A0A316IBV0_9GAMM|nr:glycosyltransferase involved in cell wall biosynthesis [Fulvimonas soli]TNY26900.1 hypothetical protein BV497_06515 [Fulvimonas soli]
MSLPRGVWFPAIRAGSGADIYTRRLASGLERMGIRTQVDWLPSRAEYAPWTVRPLSPPPWADVVHVNSWLPASLIQGDLPRVVTVHHCVHDPLYAPYRSAMQACYYRSYIRGVERRMLENAACITAVSHYTARATRNAFGPLPVEVIHNGIDLDGPFHPGTPRGATKPFRLLFVGRWVRRKAADLLAPIMTILGDGFVLSCTGDAPSRNVPANIRFLGDLPADTDLAEAYRACDALLFPSRLEGFGLVALEAQACGRPVVAARNSAIPEVVEDGCTGLLVDTDNVEAFVAAIRQLAGDRERLARMGRAARASVERRFDLQHMLGDYIKVYRRVLSST